MLKQVADGVWVRQSEWVWSNAVVVHGDAGLVLLDLRLERNPWLSGPHQSNLSQVGQPRG